MKKSTLRQIFTTFCFLLFIANVSFGQVPSYVPTSGLLGWYPFNGNADDESVNGNNGTVLTGTVLTTDRFGDTDASYLVDGLNCPDPKGISIPATIDNTGAYTISIWFQSIDSTKQDQTIFNSFPHQYIGPNLNYPFSGFENKTCSFIGDGSSWPISGATCNWETYMLHDWHHLVVTKNTTEIKFYQDGVIVFTQSIGAGINVGSFTLVAGAISINGGSQCYETFNGKIDDIGIWSYEMDAQAVTDLFNSCQMNYTLQPVDQSDFVGNNIQLTATNMPGSTYQWQSDFGSGFVDVTDAGQYTGASTSTLTVSNLTLANNNQQFRCIATYGGCTDTSNFALLTVVDASGIEKNSTQSITIYPNPVNGSLILNVDEATVGSVYNIFDVSGKVMLSGVAVNTTQIIDLGSLNTGVYFLKIYGSTKAELKIIKI
jgi:hypothetical protein